jgi:alkyldihydroxyacetonephosphate synthase
MGGEERRRSLWGWGWADKIPDAESTRNLAVQIAGVLGVAESDLPEPLTPPDPGALSLPRPRIRPADAPPGLSTILDGSDAVRAAHTYGKAYRDIVRGLHGDYAPAPDLVATPTEEAQVEQILAWCDARRHVCIPFGGGTSVVGGVEAGPAAADRPPTISLDLRGLDRVHEVERTSGLARIAAGATGPILEGQLARHGFTLRHYPQSFEFSTLGGWIVTRAGGHFATGYTHIDERVASVRMLTPTGWWESRRLPGSGAGPSPDRLVCGSEGILGVVTEAWMRVAKRPRWRSKATVHFTSYEDAVAATRAIAQSGLMPANCRLLDHREAMLNMVASGDVAVLLLGFESADRPMETPLLRAVTLAKDFGGRLPEGSVRHADDEAEERAALPRPVGGDETWRAAFIDAPYLQSALATLGIIVDTFETACTWDGFEALHAGIVRAVKGAMREACGTGLITCRFTHVYPDGPAPYYTFIAPGRTEALLEQWAAIKTAASEAILAGGGTITHHHGVGRTHRAWYDRQRPDPFAAALRAAKRAVDPNGILNPGILVDP